MLSSLRFNSIDSDRRPSHDATIAGLTIYNQASPLTDRQVVLRVVATLSAISDDLG
jgi:hypothetical protein